jgi:hypothetical protein
MICQACGVEAPTKYVAFHQNIGALFMRFSKSIKGNLCKRCIHKNFWSFTGTNLVLGWWGVISMCVTPFFIINNVARYVCCLGMESVPPGAQTPVLTDQAVESLEIVAAQIAERAGVTPAQVAMFVQEVIRAHSQK